MTDVARMLRARSSSCNGLVANVGLSQVRSEQEQELALMTAGDDVANVAQFLKPGCDSYTAAEVVERLLDTTVPVNGTKVSMAEPIAVPV